MVLPRWTKGAAATTVLPGAIGFLAAFAPTSAQAAAAGPDLRVLNPTPGSALTSNTFDLDVAFQAQNSSAVTAAELWVDGVRWVHRDLTRPQMRNVLKFTVDATTLAEGTHTLVVKVFDVNGAVSSKSLDFVAGDTTGVLSNAPDAPQLAFVTPGNGKRVSGTVEVGVEAKTQAGINPYVSFFVDKEFKTLKNYPPYTYAWDTTTTDNGWHTVEAKAFLEGASATASRRMRVFVDNPGGNTVRMDDIPDLNAAAKTPTTAKSTAKPLAIPLPKSAKAGANTTVITKNGKTAVVKMPALAGRAAPKAIPPVSAARLSPSAAPPSSAPGALGLRAAKSAPTAPVAAVPPLTVPGSAAARSARAAAPSAAALRPSAPARTDSTPKASAAVPTLSAPGAIQVAKGPTELRPLLRPATRPEAGRPTALSRSMPRAGMRQMPKPALAIVPELADTTNLLQVAFDGQQIAFDVPPRVEAGLPLAPFRQIFEHTGGVVDWVPSTRVVRAVNADREVVIAIGKNKARVNDQNVSLSKPAFIDRGRTIVPLSFVSQALNVDVQYDPATGRIQITSK